MREMVLFGILSLCLFVYAENQIGRQRANGWYHLTSGQKDSLSEEPIVTVKDFTALRLDSDYYGQHIIAGRVSRYKRDKWAYETEKAIGRQIAFVFNDSVITSPQVNQRIESGRFMITSSCPDKLPAIYEQLRKEKADSVEALFRGWERDSVYYRLSEAQKDSARMSIDYWEAKAWVDLVTKPEEHYWYSITDSAEYSRLEQALQKELEKPNVSSRASAYMQSAAYKAYKQYLCAHPEYINLMFQGFLFKCIKGLYGFLIDDIIQTRYPAAPGIRDYVDRTENADDERWTVYEWQKQVWRLMNKERSGL